MKFIKEAISYKGLKALRKDLSKARKLTKSIEKNPEREKAILGVGKIRDLKIRNKKHIQTNSDWEYLNNFKDLEKRLIPLYKQGKFVNLTNPKNIKIPNPFKKAKEISKGKKPTKIINKTTKELNNLKT